MVSRDLPISPPVHALHLGLADWVRARFNETTKVRTKSDSDSDFRWLKLFFLRVIRIGRELMSQSPTGDESESQKLMFWELIIVRATQI